MKHRASGRNQGKSDFHEVLADNNRSTEVNAASAHICSLICKSSGGARWDSTKVFTPTSCAGRPACPADVWWARMLAFSFSAFGSTPPSVDTFGIHCRVRQYIRATGESYEISCWLCIAADDDRTFRAVVGQEDMSHRREGTSAIASCRATPSPQSTTYAAPAITIT